MTTMTTQSWTELVRAHDDDDWEFDNRYPEVYFFSPTVNRNGVADVSAADTVGLTGVYYQEAELPLGVAALWRPYRLLGL